MGRRDMLFAHQQYKWDTCSALMLIPRENQHSNKPLYSIDKS